MRPITRTALGAATAAVLAVTAIAPSVAVPQDDATAKRPLVGSPAAAAQGKSTAATVTLVTGDKVLVSTDSAGRASATVVPREDGSMPLVQMRRSGKDGKDLYVYPEGVEKAIAGGTVDEELFNVTGLIRQGYDDAHADSVPLIAVYDRPVARTTSVTPRGAERGLVLDPIDGVALKADKKEAAAFWADITAPRSRSAPGLKKLWLDHKVEATLERSTKQIGADLAWAAGYDGKGTKVAVLDTGADAEHPDLKGRIVASKNFTDSKTVGDRQGHGTHTISTVGGSGAASDGKKKGVAPGAELLNGKVLNDYGSGATSWIIAGMQWAVDNKADVVSMSLGYSEIGDCSDPASMAAEELAKNSGALFVIAAGNMGSASNTVSAPGCAPSVLTVGAVDRDDSTAWFSSRGPVAVTHTLKPEISAPGVAISAAAAGGRGVYAYQSMSGTSMATPHVAGAAAIVKQRHPDWTPQQIKAALVSSARTGIPGDVRETGGGRLDVNAAIGQQVLSEPAVQGGTYNWPQDSADKTTVGVPYTNTGTADIELSLSVEHVTGNDGSTVRSPVAGLGKKTVTVPAGETVKVPLTLDPSKHLEAGQYGDITGRVVAEGPGGVHVSTPFSLYVQPETVTLWVKVIDRLGKPAKGSSSLDLVGTDDARGERRYNGGAAEQLYQLRPGSYFLSSFVTTPDADGPFLNSVSYLGRPQMEITKDTTVVLDAREAHRLKVETDRPSEVGTATLSFTRSWDDIWLHAGSLSAGRQVRGFYASVEGRAHEGDFEFGSYWRQYAPLIDRLAVEGGPQLHPVTASAGSVNLDGTGSAGLVDAGTGTAEELAAAEVSGRIALIKAPDNDSYVMKQAQAAKAAGAVAVIAYRDAPGRWYPSAGSFATPPLPLLGVPAEEGKELAARIAAGPVTLHWKATAKSPYVYNLAFPEDGPVAGDRTYRVRDSQLGVTEATYHSAGAPSDYLDAVFANRPDGVRFSLSGFFNELPVPGKRTELYSAGDTSFSQTVSSSFPYGEFMIGRPHTYKEGSKRTENWYGGVLAPAAPLDNEGKPQLVAERQGNLIGIATAFWGDTEHWGAQGSFGDIGGVDLRINGGEADHSPYPWGVFEVPDAEASYELTLYTEKFGIPSRNWKRSTTTATTWKFRSKLDENVYSQGLPVMFPKYDLPEEDGNKTLAAADGQTIGLSVGGHAGYTPGAITAAKMSYSYDGGATWTEAKTSHGSAGWTATVDHAGAAGKTVTLKTELTDDRGNAVTQTVESAYGLR
ncbi:S8 family serine peptidase (plasmid) [Streptomyces sp. NBC_00841]|uniref:S8 family peptidase n=1 Tax=Streptomyces sp. NBC_00841 TaxID=2975847 RepID=UPI002DD836F9|nr:S8 family serine peptidase [Streptomyces sp. NBC_00841]WSA04758.1 S8 family serine peptidase [Streptomyces sp. NBC_00841]